MLQGEAATERSLSGKYLLGQGSLAAFKFELFSCVFAVRCDKPMEELVIPVVREYFLGYTMDRLIEDLKEMLNNIQIFK